MTELAAAVIEISAYGESCRPGIKSILRNAAHVASLHIVKSGNLGDEEEQLYATWADDRKSLAEASIAVVWHSAALDLTKVAGHALIHVSPDHQIAKGGLEPLYQDLRAKNVHGAAVASVTLFDHGSIAYGFLLPLLLLHALRGLFRLFRYYRTSDLRAQTLIRTYNKRVHLARSIWPWNTATLRSGADNDVIQVPEPGDGGWAFVLRSIMTHNHLGAGQWFCGGYLWLPVRNTAWINILAMHHLLCGIPWWLTLSFIGSYRTTLAFAWLFVYVCNMLLAVILAHASLEMPRAWLYAQVALYPLYLTLLPIVLVVGRWYRPFRRVAKQ